MPTIRWIIRNLGLLLLSFILAVTVWASAVVTTDPNQEGAFQPVKIDVIGLASDLLLTNKIPEQAIISLKAPRSIWEQLNSNPALVSAWIDLTGYAAGEHTSKVNVKIDTSPFRIIKIEPASVTTMLEPLVTKSFPIRLIVRGEPPLGYSKGTPTISPDEVVITGSESAVERIAEVIATLDINAASQTIRSTLPVRPIDENGATVSEVSITPKEISVVQPISILGGYKNLAVKVITTGSVADGYRLTNISVTPPTITVYSSDPGLVNELPGYIDTMPVDLNGLTDDTEFNTALNLPAGVSLVNEPGVLVQIGVAAIEDSITLALPVEALGLSPTLAAVISPPTVEVIVTGPMPVLETLTPASFRAVVDLTGKIEGTYQITPTLDLVPEEVQIQAIIPETVEVEILIAPTPTPTTRSANTPTASQPAVTPSPTRRP
jgi:YbbR domain-containing protein